MPLQIYNGGIFGGLLRIVKDSGTPLSDKDEARLELLESLPRNTWIDLDENGNPISKEDADKNMAEHLSKFKAIKPEESSCSLPELDRETLRDIWNPPSPIYP